MPIIPPVLRGSNKIIFKGSQSCVPIKFFCYSDSSSGPLTAHNLYTLFLQYLRCNWIVGCGAAGCNNMLVICIKLKLKGKIKSWALQGNMKLPARAYGIATAKLLHVTLQYVSASGCAVGAWIPTACSMVCSYLSSWLSHYKVGSGLLSTNITQAEVSQSG